MTGVDLTPARRRNHRRLKGVLRIWGASALGVAVAVGASCALASVAAAGHETTARQLSDANRRVTTLQQQSHEILRQLTRAAVAQKQALALSDQPDWSILLRLVAAQLDAQSSLRSLKLEKATAAAGGAVRYELALSGAAPSAGAVSAFALRLQSLGLFDSVSLVRTMRSAIGDASVVAFEMNCVLTEAGGTP
jgi:Tfp pilus assembly protein PilN